MSTVVDDDVLAAVKALWATDHAELPVLVDGPPEAGRLKSPQVMPYAHLSCEQLRPPVRSTGGGWLDFRKVVITLRGTKAQVVAAAVSVQALYRDGVEMPLPSGAPLVALISSGQGKLQQDPAVKDGLDVWMATLDIEVWSGRTE